MPKGQRSSKEVKKPKKDRTVVVKPTGAPLMGTVTPPMPGLVKKK